MQDQADMNRLLNLEPDQRLLEISREILEIEAQLLALDRQGLLFRLREVFSSLAGNSRSDVEEAKRQLRLRLEDLRAQTDPNYAHRLQSTRRQVQAMQKALDRLMPPDPRGGLSDLIHRWWRP